MSEYYNKDGYHISNKEHHRLMGLKDYKRVAVDANDTYRVSTCWLGFDYGNGWSSPVIFETLAFDVKTGKPYAEYLERYCYEEEALAGHKMVCEKLGVKVKENNE